LDTLAAHPRLAKYMDMPLQHASRNMLARMKRGSHGDAFFEIAGTHPGDDSGRLPCAPLSSSVFRRNPKPISMSCAILCAAS